MVSFFKGQLVVLIWQALCVVVREKCRWNRPAIKGAESNKSFEQTPKVRLKFVLNVDCCGSLRAADSAAQLNSMLERIKIRSVE